ncbi:hypothetical protein BDR26DRAFT_1011563 [Obelidium mucronatum]|nr:hypothetical protein BDR26DRAFT_1011563 [Obelidium mucronatum]
MSPTWHNRDDDENEGSKWGCAPLRNQFAACDTPICDRRTSRNKLCPGSSELYCLPSESPIKSSLFQRALFHHRQPFQLVPDIPNPPQPAAPTQVPATVIVLADGGTVVHTVFVTGVSSISSGSTLTQSSTIGLQQQQQQQDSSSASSALIIVIAVVGSLIALLIAAFLFVKICNNNKTSNVVQVSSLATSTAAESSTQRDRSGFVEPQSLTRDGAGPAPVAGGLNTPVANVILVPTSRKYYRDDYFDDESVSIDVNSTYISVKENEIRPFDPKSAENRIASPIDNSIINNLDRNTRLPAISPSEDDDFAVGLRKAQGIHELHQIVQAHQSEGQVEVKKAPANEKKDLENIPSMETSNAAPQATGTMTKGREGGSGGGHGPGKEGPKGGGLQLPKGPTEVYACVPKSSAVTPLFSVDCNDQPCWRSTLLCQDPQTTCRVAQVNSFCLDKRYMIPPGTVIPPINVSLSDFNSTGLLFNVPWVSQATTSSSLNAVPIPVAAQNVSSETAPMSIAVISSIVGAVMFVFGILIAFAVIPVHELDLHHHGMQKVVKDNDDGEEVEMQLSPTGPLDKDGENRGRTLQAYTQRRRWDSNNDPRQPAPRGFRDDFFDETSSIGQSTHISIGVDEIREFQVPKEYQDLVVGGQNSISQPPKASTMAAAFEFWSCTAADVAGCSEQPCWASLRLCDGLPAPCKRVAQPPAPCDGRFAYANANGGVSPFAPGPGGPADRPLAVLPLRLFFLATKPTQATAAATVAGAATTSTATTTATTTTTTATATPLQGAAPIAMVTVGGSSGMIFGGAIGGICFLLGVIAAYALFGRKRKTEQEVPPVSTSSYAAVGGSSSSKYDKVGVSTGSDELQRQQQPQGNSNYSTKSIGRRQVTSTTAADDFFDDSSSIGISTHISVDVTELRPFQKDAFKARSSWRIISGGDPVSSSSCYANAYNRSWWY